MVCLELRPELQALFTLKKVIVGWTNNDDLLQQAVITSLMDLVKQAGGPTLAAKTLREIGQSALYHGAYGDWERAVTPLIELVRDVQQGTAEQEWWSGPLVQFKTFCNEQQARTSGDL